MAHLYDIGTRAWQPHAEQEWIASEVTAKNVVGDKVKLVFQLENGEVHAIEGNYSCFKYTVCSHTSLQTKTVETTVETLEHDPDGTLPPLMNPSMLEASDDLTNLSHLNEPAGMCNGVVTMWLDGGDADVLTPVLHAIKLRYSQKEIYTYSGIVLIAVNPFAKVDSLYVPGMVQVYAGKTRSASAPHLFAIAEEAFT